MMRQLNVTICSAVQAESRCDDSRPRRPLAALLTGFLILMAVGQGSPVRAQTPSPLAEWQYSAGIPLFRLFEGPPTGWNIILGPAATYRPLYDGAGSYRVLAGANIDIRYGGLFFFSTGEGLGANVLSGTNWRAGAALTYNLGRREADDRSHLSGLGNINPAPETKFFVDYVISKELPLVLRLDVRRSLGGSDGWIGDLGAYLPLPGSSEKFFWFAGPTVSFADSRYMNAWFGINQGQSALSGRPQYSAHGGIKSYGGGVTAVYFFSRHWFVTGDAAISQIAGSAAASPITQKATNWVCDASFNYLF